MNKKGSSSGQRNGLIAAIASVIATGAIVFFAKRKNKSSTQSQSQAETAEDTSPVSAAPKRTPTNTQIDSQSETASNTPHIQEMQQGEIRHNEKERDDLLLEMDALTKEEGSLAVLAKLKEITNHWKEIGPVSADKFQEYRDHFQSNYEKIKENCAAFIEEKDVKRQENLADKETICHYRNESYSYSKSTYNPYSKPTKRMTDYERLLQGTRVIDLPTNPNYNPFGGLSDWRDELVDDE